MSEIEDYILSMFPPNAERMKPLSGSSSDEVEIIQELKVKLDEHRCDLCNTGGFLLSQLMQFGGLEHKYVCDFCLKSFKTKSLALSHAKKHRHKSLKDTGHVSDARSSAVVFDVRTGAAVVEDETVSVVSTGAVGIEDTTASDASKSSTAETTTHTCSICCKSYKSERGLKMHHTIQHGKIHLCNKCGSRFNSLKNFQKHYAKCPI